MIGVREGVQEKLYVTAITIVLITMGLLALYPVINVAAVSLSSGSEADRGQVFLWPREVNLDSWKVIVSSGPLWRSLVNTIYVAGVGSILSLGFTALMAYPLANKKMRFRGLVMIFVVVTMILRYPLIPYFLAVRSYGLMNNLWSLIATHLLVAYNLVIMRTFFQQLPEEMEESALIEGANHLQILMRITLPLSKPVLATLGLFFAVSYWNLFLHPMLFIQKPELMTLQVRLRSMMQSLESDQRTALSVVNYSTYTVQAAAIMFATIPILIVYPFLQKYFVKGAMLGSLKG